MTSEAAATCLKYGLGLFALDPRRGPVSGGEELAVEPSSIFVKGQGAGSRSGVRVLGGGMRVDRGSGSMQLFRG